MTKASAGPSKVMWCEFRDSKLLRVLLNNVPDDFFCHMVAPDHTLPANAPKDFAIRDASCNQPVIYDLLNPIGHWDCSDVASFPDQINDCPMVFATLEMVEREFSQFTSSESTAKQNCQNRSISLSF